MNAFARFDKEIGSYAYGEEEPPDRLYEPLYPIYHFIDPTGDAKPEFIRRARENGARPAAYLLWRLLPRLVSISFADAGEPMDNPRWDDLFPASDKRARPEEEEEDEDAPRRSKRLRPEPTLLDEILRLPHLPPEILALIFLSPGNLTPGVWLRIARVSAQLREVIDAGAARELVRQLGLKVRDERAQARLVRRPDNALNDLAVRHDRPIPTLREDRRVRRYSVLLRDLYLERWLLRTAFEPLRQASQESRGGVEALEGLGRLVRDAAMATLLADNTEAYHKSLAMALIHSVLDPEARQRRRTIRFSTKRIDIKLYIDPDRKQTEVVMLDVHVDGSPESGTTRQEEREMAKLSLLLVNACDRVELPAGGGRVSLSDFGMYGPAASLPLPLSPIIRLPQVLLGADAGTAGQGRGRGGRPPLLALPRR